jgi:hypothetical protein
VETAVLALLEETPGLQQSVVTAATQVPVVTAVSVVTAASPTATVVTAATRATRATAVPARLVPRSAVREATAVMRPPAEPEARQEAVSAQLEPPVVPAR